MARRPLTLPGALLALLLVTALAVVVALPGPSHAASVGSLQDEIAGKRDREARLGDQAARLGALERRVSRQVQLLQRRLAAVQADYDAAQARLVKTQDELRAERARAIRLRNRLATGRTRLAQLLRDRYMNAPPDIVTVVLNAHGFADLLERANFLKRIKDSDTQVVDVVKTARAESKILAAKLAKLEQGRAVEFRDARRRRDAIASITSALTARRNALTQARAARLAARQASISGRHRAERTLDKLLAQQQRAAVSSAGPGGPWAIPWAIVQCESGGQDLPPNGAGASGYYQFLPSTWKGLGGSTPAAYQAPKAEQDRLAARLWAGGAGASNWDCAAIVGVK